MAVSSQHINPSLVAGLQSGSEDALKQLLNLLGPRILAYCRKKGMGNADAEELLQDVFVKLWLYREKLDLNANFEAFVFTITRNAIYNFARKLVGYELTATGTLHDDVGVWDVQTDSFEHIYRQYQRIMQQADETRREAFRLSREEGLTHRQIAQQLQLPVRTVEYYISAMLQVLRTELKDSLILLAIFLFR